MTRGILTIRTLTGVALETDLPPITLSFESCSFSPFRELPMKWNRVFVIALVLLATQLAVAQDSPAIAEREAPTNHEPGLLSRWHFVQTHLLGNTFFPDAGTLHATILGPA